MWLPTLIIFQFDLFVRCYQTRSTWSISFFIFSLSSSRESEKCACVSSFASTIFFSFHFVFSCTRPASNCMCVSSHFFLLLLFIYLFMKTIYLNGFSRIVSSSASRLKWTKRRLFVWSKRMRFDLSIEWKVTDKISNVINKQKQLEKIENLKCWQCAFARLWPINQPGSKRESRVKI